MNEDFLMDYRKLGLKIAYYRKLKEFTQENLAERANIHPTFLGRIECGVKCASLDTIFSIARALGIPAYKLFQFDD